jgi:uncharacterized protein
MKQQKIRDLHRDLGYFYIGLIISFALSGILMNHRDSWHAEKYDTQIKKITVQLPEKSKITDGYVKDFITKFGIKDVYRRHKIKGGSLRISYKNTDVEVDLKSGKGEIETYKKTPIISQMMKLHKNTSNWWIYYGDIFGLSLITIAITGAIMIPAGKFTFKKRGWKLALAGLIVPLLILILIG